MAGDINGALVLLANIIHLGQLQLSEDFASKFTPEYSVCFLVFYKEFNMYFFMTV